MLDPATPLWSVGSLDELLNHPAVQIALGMARPENPSLAGAANLAKFKNMLEANSSYAEIGKELGVTAGMARAKAIKEGLHSLATSPKPTNPIRTSPENMSALDEMLGRRASYGEIARRFGITKDAAAGVVRRTKRNSPEAMTAKSSNSITMPQLNSLKPLDPTDVIDPVDLANYMKTFGYK